MVDESARGRLLGVQLAVLARENGASGDVSSPGDFGLGAALVAGDTAWVLVDREPHRGLGPAVAWALRHGAAAVELLASTATGTLARRAEQFALPVTVWHVDGRTLLPAVAEPLPAPAGLQPGHRQFSELIAAGGAVPVVEHGVLTGEVAGLEVCRVVTDQFTGEARLEVGVGAHDRETFQLLHGDRPTVEALAGVVAAVSVHRADGAAGHPLNRLARARAMRARLVAEPATIGAEHVTPVDPPVARVNVKDEVPCVALASIGQQTVTVVCSAGVDLDVVPYACDARRATGTVDAMVVVDAGNDLPVQHRVAAALRRPMRIVALDASIRS